MKFPSKDSPVVDGAQACVGTGRRQTKAILDGCSARERPHFPRWLTLSQLQELKRFDSFVTETISYMRNEIYLEKSRAWELLKLWNSDLDEEFDKTYGAHQDRQYRVNVAVVSSWEHAFSHFRSDLLRRWERDSALATYPRIDWPDTPFRSPREEG